MVEYPKQDFQNFEEEEAYKEGYQISRLIRDLEILGIIEGESYDQDVSTLDELLYQFGFDSLDEEKVIDMDFDDFDREDDFRRELMREVIEQERKEIVDKLRALGVDLKLKE
tara:strand:+ start:223 stop:558 length:336 start_codon:yes stop_codon:yes gene_type:complete